VASAVGSCAGRCVSGDVCLAAAAAGDPETCATPTTDCADGVRRRSRSCVGAHLSRGDADADRQSICPRAPGSSSTLVTLADGASRSCSTIARRTSLVMLVENAPGAGAFTETVLDGTGDRGMWASALVGPDGTLHVAYQDARADTVHYLSWNGSPSPTELVDDGTRAGDRTHPVGAGATVFLRGGAPAIAYQDAATADLVVAAKSGATWTPTPIASTRNLDGFHLAAAGATLAWDALDPTALPPGKLEIQQQ
jgi:hypothetical protein